MKKFDEIKIGRETITGGGNHQKTDNGLVINSDSHEIITFFKKSMRDRIKLGVIEFKLNKQKDIYSGDYIIKNITGNSITLVKS